MATSIELVRDRRPAARAVEFSWLRPHVDARLVRSRRRRSSTIVRDQRRRRRCVATPPGGLSSRTSTARSPRTPTTPPASSRRCPIAQASSRAGSTTSSVASSPSGRGDGERRFALRRRPPARRADATRPGRRRSTTTPAAGGSGRAAPSTSLRVGSSRTSRRSSSTESCAISTPTRRGALRRAGDVTIDWDLEVGPSRPVAINGEAVVTVDAGTFATVGADSTVQWRPFELADAWGDGRQLGRRLAPVLRRRGRGRRVAGCPALRHRHPPVPRP